MRFKYFQRRAIFVLAININTKMLVLCIICLILAFICIILVYKLCNHVIRTINYYIKRKYDAIDSYTKSITSNTPTYKQLQEGYKQNISDLGLNTHKIHPVIVAVKEWAKNKLTKQ